MTSAVSAKPTNPYIPPLRTSLIPQQPPPSGAPVASAAPEYVTKQSSIAAPQQKSSAGSSGGHSFRQRFSFKHGTETAINPTPSQPHTARAVLQGPAATPHQPTPRGYDDSYLKPGILVKFLDSLKASLGFPSQQTSRRDRNGVAAPTTWDPQNQPPYNPYAKQPTRMPNMSPNTTSTFVTTPVESGGVYRPRECAPSSGAHYGVSNAPFVVTAPNPPPDIRSGGYQSSTNSLVTTPPQSSRPNNFLPNGGDHHHITDMKAFSAQHSYGSGSVSTTASSPVSAGPSSTGNGQSTPAVVMSTPVVASSSAPSYDEASRGRSPQAISAANAMHGRGVMDPYAAAPGFGSASVSTSYPQNESTTQQDVYSHSPRVAHPPASKQVRFAWRVARSLLKLRMQPAEKFTLYGVPFLNWDLHKIPTLGASPTSCRVQEMFRTTLQDQNKTMKPLSIFVKRIPIAVWRKQYESQNKWNGEFVTDGENFVMEAAALAFLQEYGHSIAPTLLGILELSAARDSTLGVNNGVDSEDATQTTSQKRSWCRPGTRGGTTGDDVTHVVIVSELYGEDLLDFLDRREKENRPLQNEEKRRLQFECLSLLRRLHCLGFAHLDFTPENVLYGTKGLRLCDFAKATPLWTCHHRHVMRPKMNGAANLSTWFPFESCEPTVGKGAYMPPECWKVYWKLEETKVQFPLEELWPLRNPHERSTYYFRVCEADVYMIGVLMFWIWSEGGIWKCSDPRQDEKYSHLVKTNLNFDLFRECRSWPTDLKTILQQALQPEALRRATLDELLNHSWFSGLAGHQYRQQRSLQHHSNLLHQNQPPQT